jgi:hypothetical protein
MHTPLKGSELAVVVVGTSAAQGEKNARTVSGCFVLVYKQ